MICKVRKTIEKYNMPLDNRTVVIGVSGGADSMTLLHIMHRLQSELDFRIIVCHLNHSIRGEEADSDERFVKEQCEKLGVEFRALKLNIPEMAKKSGQSIEECGRNARYEFFSSVKDNAVIATAHTLSDRTETLIFNMARGTSVKGLVSIPPVRGNIIRPLIECTRSEIESYCAENNIEYVTDKTNFDDTYTRNRIRLNIIPQLKVINPAFERSVTRLCEAVSMDEDFFSYEVSKLLERSRLDNGYNADIINESHSAIKRRAIVKILSDEADIRAEQIHVQMTEDILSGGKTEITGNTTVQVKNGVLSVNPPCEEVDEWERDFSSLFADTPNGEVKGRIFNKSDLPAKQIVHNKVLDYDKIIGKLILRNRRAGDKMKTAGNTCTKSLKKLFKEKNIDNKNSVMILADDSGIVWIDGIGCCDRCKITENSMNILFIGDVSQND